jgi:[ribulose-bisphosphate carboxylase]/[fructose-bisphosphate aldolase]-lysine N-methyltransferase
MLIALLPGIDALDQPFLWTDEECEMLKGSAVKDKASTVRDGIREEWEDVRPILNEPNVTLKDYAWATAIVTSRAFALGSTFPLVLVPLADLATHADPIGGPNASIIAAGGVFFSKPKVNVVSASDIVAGDEITVKYAEDGATAGDYLLDYGFVPAFAPASVELSFEPTMLDPFFEDKEDVLTTAGLDLRASFSLSDASTRGQWIPPDGMDQFLRLVCLGSADAFLLEAVFRRDVWGFLSLPVSEANERAMCDAVIAACEDALDGYTAKLFGDDSRVALAKLVINGERSALRACVKHYANELQMLDSRMYYQERRLLELDLLRPLDESEIIGADGGGRISRTFDENYS